METLKKVGSKIKVILTQLFAFLLSFFKIEPTEERITKKEEKEKETVSQKREKISITNDNTPLPDESDTKTGNHLNYKQSITVIDKDKIAEIKSKTNEKEIYFSKEVILNTLMEVLEEKNDFYYSDLSKKKKEKIEKERDHIGEVIIPPLKEEMLANKIENTYALKDSIYEKIDTIDLKPIKDILKEEELIEEKDSNIVIENRELNIKPIKQKREKMINITPIDKKERRIAREKRKDKPIKPLREGKVYFIADLLPDKQNNMHLHDVTKIDTTKNLIVDTNKDIAKTMIVKSKKLPFIMVPTNQMSKQATIDKIKNAVVDTSLLAASTVLNDEKEETSKEEVINTVPKKNLYISEEEISPEEQRLADIAVDKQILEELKDDIKKEQRRFNPFMEEAQKIEEIKVKEQVKKETENINKEIQNEKKDLLDAISKEKDEIMADIEDVKREIEEIDLPKKKGINVVVNKNETPNNEITNLKKETEDIIINTNKELVKEELEDKNYEKYEKQIDKLLYEIEMYKIKNEENITKDEKDILTNEKDKLKALRSKLDNQKEQDIEKETKELEKEITEQEINSIQEEIKKLHLEHQKEVSDKILDDLKKIEDNNDSKMAEIEQQLIKSKLKKAAHAAEIPSILALPFIKHKYFFYFTIGLFVNNHFNFLNAIFKRKNTQYNPIDLTEIKNGYDALEKAIDMTYENKVYLDYLENEAVTKYPNLRNDEDFNKYITRLHTKLDNNYKKLQNKQKAINKYIKKITKKNKTYKKYKLIKKNNKEG